MALFLDRHDSDHRTGPTTEHTMKKTVKIFSGERKDFLTTPRCKAETSDRIFGKRQCDHRAIETGGFCTLHQKAWDAQNG